MMRMSVEAAIRLRFDSFATRPAPPLCTGVELSPALTEALPPAFDPVAEPVRKRSFWTGTAGKTR